MLDAEYSELSRPLYPLGRMAPFIGYFLIDSAHISRFFPSSFSWPNKALRRLEGDSFRAKVLRQCIGVYFDPARGFGAVWRWTAICVETKLVLSWLVGARDLCHANAFVKDLGERLVYRIQITTDGHTPYLEAVAAAFGGDVDDAMLVKLYGSEATKNNPEARHSPGEFCGTEIHSITSKPDGQHISASYAERQNLTMRMRMRRFTRLTNGFSKKIANHEHMIALHYMVYNFVRRHQTLRMSPAMAAGVSKSLWSIKDIVALLG